jgi:hypothetical protein
MALIRKEILVEVKVGDIVKSSTTIYNDSIKLYVCYIEGDLLYISDDKKSLKEDCEKSFVEDCYLV